MFFHHFVISVLMFAVQTLGAYQENGQNIALYWGAGGGQERLSYYCNSGAADIMILSFVNSWNKNSASYNFGNACDQYPATCPKIEEDIKLCQSLGIKVLLSLGGDDRRGKYGLKKNEDGDGLGQVVYDMFHPDGKGKVKPFGTAEVDGFDFDIENGNDKGLANAVVKIRSLWTTKKLLFSAAPQCPFPDHNVDRLLRDKNAALDIAFVMYYHNSCKMGNPDNFEKNWKTWADFIDGGEAGNPNMKFYVGLAAKTDFENAEYIGEKSVNVKKFKNFAGFFLWDAVSSFAITDKSGVNYVEALRTIIRSETMRTKTITSSATSTLVSTSIYKTTGTTTVTNVNTNVSKGKTLVTQTSTAVETKTVDNVAKPVTVYYAGTTKYKTTVTSLSTRITTSQGKYKATSVTTQLFPSTTTSTMTYMSEIGYVAKNLVPIPSKTIITSLSTSIGDHTTKVITEIATKQ